MKLRKKTLSDDVKIVARKAERNLLRYIQPPTITNQLGKAHFAIQEWVWRHITKRELFRQIEALRLALPKHTTEEEDESTRARLERIRKEWQARATSAE